MIGIDFFADFMVMGLRDYLLSPVLDNVELSNFANSNNPSSNSALSHHTHTNFNHIF